jgi:ketosteroid isomerase-like protein
MFKTQEIIMKIKSNPFTLAFIALIGLCFTTLSWAHGEEKHPDSSPFFVNTDTVPAKVVKAFHLALKSGDKAKARSLLADDVLIFEGGVERSADQYANHHMLADMKYLAVVETKNLEHQVSISGEMALSVSRSKTTGNYKDKEVDYEGLETIVLKLSDGEWKITHIHWSR